MAPPFDRIVRPKQRTAPPEGSSVYPRSAAGTLCSKCREERRTDGGRSSGGEWLGRYLSSCERRGCRAAGAREVLLVCLLARHGRAQLPREDERGQGRGRSGGSGPTRRSLQFAIRASAETWREFGQEIPPPMCHGLFAASFREDMSLEGDLLVLMQNLRCVVPQIELLRTTGVPV